MIPMGRTMLAGNCISVMVLVTASIGISLIVLSISRNRTNRVLITRPVQRPAFEAAKFSMVNSPFCRSGRLGRFIHGPMDAEAVPQRAPAVAPEHQRHRVHDLQSGVEGPLKPAVDIVDDQLHGEAVRG